MTGDSDLHVNKFLQEVTIPCIDEAVNEKQLKLIDLLVKQYNKTQNFRCDKVIQTLRADPSFKGGFTRQRAYYLQTLPKYAEFKEYATKYAELLDLAYPVSHFFVFMRLLTGGLYNYKNPPSVLKLAFTVISVDELKNLEQEINTVKVVPCLSTRGLPINKDTKPVLQQWALNRYPEYQDKEYTTSFDEALGSLLDGFMPEKLEDVTLTYQLIGTGMNLVESFLRDEPNGKRLLERAMRYRIDLTAFRSIDKSTNDGELVSDSVAPDQLVDAVKSDIKLLRGYLIKRDC